MITEGTLKEQFEIVGCNIESDEALKKCIELCHEFSKDEEQIVEMWVAFSISKFGNIDLTLNGIQQLERTERNREKSPSKQVVNDSISSADVDNDEILHLYGYKPPVPVTPTSKRQRSPIFGSSGPDNKVFAIETFSPSTPSRYNSRTGPGKVTVIFGEKRTLWKIKKQFKVPIKLADFQANMPTDAMYMFDVISDGAIQRAVSYMKLGKEICKRWGKIKENKLLYTPDVKIVSQTNFVTWGRIRCDMYGKLNKVSTELEGICFYRDEIGEMRIKSSIVPINLSQVSEFSVFPGQIIAVEGVNMSGHLLEVKSVFSGGYAEPADAPKLENDIIITVAAGPFTSIDNLNYEPLMNLLERIKEEEPHVLILIGPFVEYTHPQIDNVSQFGTHQDLFEKMISTVMESLSEKCTQVVIIPSSRDAHHEAIYPTPSYYLPRSLQNSNLHSMPDPCVLDIDGLTIGITAVDILKHLGNEELSSNSIKLSKLHRVANHILSQACFYPLYPPAEEVNVDTNLWKNYAFMKKQPHILILPSDMGNFCKNINDCVVLNPQRLCKHSFARMHISSSENQKWDQSQIACEILKV
ncbi:DNA polymerase alpha subunit B isoform X2 [Leptopilina heterotoma]|uniref:DNA polymerase alpha subunit B isoform X2 n=1 Tax=Leptopilina heterotoma TaxID=63436 RepID=UPI001CA919AD|nr:DNA polymerase alpha subunit B isoform X2 [Leptopilina heterotoma]